MNNPVLKTPWDGRSIKRAQLNDGDTTFQNMRCCTIPL